MREAWHSLKGTAIITSRMNKRQLHHLWTKERVIKPWFFLIPALLLAVVCVFALRANSAQMAELREDVYTADRDNGDVQGALIKLQAHVISHMNTNLNTGNNVYPPVQLQYTYQRLVQQQGSNLQAANSELYTQAQAYCQAQNPSDFSGRNRVPCIQKYVQERGVKTNMASTISPSLYQFDFVSPRWSPDLAGWSMVLSVLFVLLAIAKFAFDRWLKNLVR